LSFIFGNLIIVTFPDSLLSVAFPLTIETALRTLGIYQPLVHFFVISLLPLCTSCFQILTVLLCTEESSLTRLLWRWRMPHVLEVSCFWCGRIPSIFSWWKVFVAAKTRRLWRSAYVTVEAVTWRALCSGGAHEVARVYVRARRDSHVATERILTVLRTG
jgi:hypothetical protein